ncbi:MAG TPA: tetratricopeptide repeat protein [Verrucomicrobiae bacterium]|nr:tetratricopeptide repeat protein [Verrucomicrobiae bacterium]
MITESEPSVNQTPRSAPKNPDRAKAQLAGALLFLVVLWAFLPAIHNGFLTYDDPEYVTNNPYVKTGLSIAGLKWAFSAHGANWHPITWLSHMLDGQIYGLQPWGHHFNNVLLHAANCFLVFWVLRKMTGATWRSFFVALLFGLHPLRVESVAWVAERKDVLSVFFFMLTLWAYSDYAQETNANSPRAKIHYALALVWFVLGLLSKSMLVTLPFVLLLLDFWPLERLRQNNFKKLLTEKIPFFVLSAAMCWIARNAQKNGAAMVSTMPFCARLENALVAYCRYIEKLFWPANVSPFYPRADSWPIVLVCAAALFLVMFSIAAFVCRKERPWWFVGWFWYLGTLVPVIGLIQIGEQSLADRYTYIPCIGILIALVWTVGALTKEQRRREIAASTATFAAAVTCLVLTRQQIGYWKTTESLFARAVAVTPDSTMACVGLGASLAERGQFEQAIRLYRHALLFSPDYYEAHNNLGLALAATGHLDDAIEQYRLAFKNRPTADCLVNLGVALAKQGHPDAAIAEFKHATVIDADNQIAQSNLALLLLRKGQFAEAIEHLRAALKSAPENAELHDELGSALAQTGQFEAAIAEFQTALKFNPILPHAAENLAHAQKLESSAKK